MGTTPLPPFDRTPSEKEELAEPSSPRGGATSPATGDSGNEGRSPNNMEAAAHDDGTSMSPAGCGHRESPIADIFVGPTGLYPGTRWLIYLALGALVFLIADWLTQQFRVEYAGSLAGSVAWEIMMMLAAILPAFVMTRLEGRSFADFGLPPRQAFRRNFWMGSLWGFCALSLLMLVLRLAGAYEFGSLSVHGKYILKFAVYYAVFFLATGFFEDFLFRGYSQWVLSRGMNFWPAAALLSVGFGAIHTANPGEAKTGLIAAGLIGFFFCLALRRTGSLWWPIGFHMSWDWGESFFYSVPDSGGMSPGHLLNSSFHGPAWLTGGTVGPEGSLLIFPLLLALWIVFDRLHPEIKYDPR